MSAALVLETSVPEDYQDQDSFFGGEPPLSEAVGYVVVLIFGVFFSFFTTFLVWLDSKFNGVNITSEHFNTAGRSIKTGLTASVIVSQWTWAATLLQSSNVAFNYGVSGPFWYASGATIQVLLFGILAIEVKRKAPTCHTFLEIIQARWGDTAHKVFLFFALLTNIIVTSMLLLGGAATVNALTGLNLNLASFLIPWGVIAYTMHGGLKATFLASYTHTTVLFVALLIFVFVIYAGDDKYIGSPGSMYDKLQAITKIEDCSYGSTGQFTLSPGCGPVKGNEEGSYLTMLSREGFIFGIINIVGNFGTVFVDQSYWQSAIAAKPQSSHKGYLLGGMCWFTIPFALATSLGLAALAMQLPLTKDEAGAGLVPPATALFVLGKGGATLILIMLFMAVTSTGSAELIAVSSLVSYDIYRAYINPQATGEQILKVSRYTVFIFGALMGVLAIGLNEIGLNLGWVYLFMGIVIGSAVVPVSMVLTWKKATANGAMAGAISGQICAIIAWLVSTSALYGDINLENTGKNYPMLTGNLVAICFSGIVCIVVSLANPDDYDWESTRNISMVETYDNAWHTEADYNETDLSKAKAWIMKIGLAFTLVIVFAWPVFTLPAGVFSEGYFNFWVALSILWGIISTLFVVFLPLWESKDAIMQVFNGICKGGVPPPKQKALTDRAKMAEKSEKANGAASHPPPADAAIKA